MSSCEFSLLKYIILPKATSIFSSLLNWPALTRAAKIPGESTLLLESLELSEYGRPTDKVMVSSEFVLEAGLSKTDRLERSLGLLSVDLALTAKAKEKMPVETRKKNMNLEFMFFEIFL